MKNTDHLEKALSVSYLLMLFIFLWGKNSFLLRLGYIRNFEEMVPTVQDNCTRDEKLPKLWKRLDKAMKCKTKTQKYGIDFHIFCFFNIYGVSSIIYVLCVYELISM